MADEDQDILVPELLVQDEDQEIEVGGDDDEDDSSEPAAAAKPDGSKPSRRERRNNRGNELLEAERRRADEAIRQNQETLRTLQQLAQRPVYAQPVQPQQQGPDQWEAQAHQLRQEQTNLTQAFHAAHARGDQAAVDQLEQQAWQLRERMEQNTYIRNVRKFGVPQQQQAPQMSPQQIEHMVESASVKRRFQEEHPDILADKRAAMVFQANFQKLLHMDRPDSWETLSAAAEQTRAELRMKPRGGKPAASAATKSRLSGMGAGISSASSSGPKVVKMDKKRREWATAAFPHLPEAQAYQKWAREVGAKTPESA